MCGICGFIDYGNGNRLGEPVIRNMCKKLSHRGPDDEGVYLNKNVPWVGLGHRRLSIIDLSEAGHQPMSNEDNTVWLVLNGEIYNFKELRAELESQGHIFKSNTDTETLIHLYEERGEECVKYLRGMFAFAIWDIRNNKMLLARDRAGKKPLVYAHFSGIFSFSSELESLLESGTIEKRINLNSLDYYLGFGYIPAPLTIYEGVFKLPPASILIFSKDNLTITKYWDLDYVDKLRISEEEAQEELLRLLEEAVKIRLCSDVPLGAFLSGGIDSSTIVALMSRLSAKKVKTFSIGFEDSGYSELGYAGHIARIYGTEHHEFIVRPKAMETLPLLVERYGEPYADSSCLPTYYLSKETKGFVTVALNGDGGDESFAGYDRYQAMLIASRLENMPLTIKYLVRRLALLLPDSTDSKNRFRRIRRFFEAAFLPAHVRYAKWVSIFDESLKREIYSDDLLNSVSLANSEDMIRDFIPDKNKEDIVDALLNTDVHTYLPDDLLVKVDIASMANSLEARSPFLDYKVMEFAARLPFEYKLKSGVKKYILKRAIKGLVPPENIHRPKMGFGLPIGRWLRQDLKNYIKESLLSRQSLGRGYFRPEIVKNMVNEHTEGRKDYSFQLWALLMFELWHKRFIDNG